MPFSPRLKTQIHQELLARIIARSQLTDVEPSSVINAILSTLAEEFEAVEFNMLAVRDSFDIRKVAAQYLDDRVSELPPSGLTRLGAAAASGAVLEFKRENTTGALTIPKGSTFGRPDADVLYVLQSDVTMADGQGTYPSGGTAYATVTASVPGTIGNAPAGTITEIVDGPGTLSSVTNPNPILGGQNIESDQELRERAQLYISSLARCQKAALEALALSFESTTGIRIRHAKVLEDPLNPGTVELIVDDGSGLEGLDGEFVASTVQTVGVNLSPILYHEKPATEPITSLLMDFGDGYVTVKAEDFEVTKPGWVSHPEQGLIILQYAFLKIPNSNKIVASGTKIKVPANQFRKYSSVIAELQEFIEGRPDDPDSFPGLRAAGTRVIVRPPLVENIDLKFSLVFVSGTDFLAKAEEVKILIVSYLRDLAPGQSLFLGRLTSFLIDGVEELLSIHFQDPTTDRAPSTPRHALRAKAADMIILQQNEV